MARQIWEWHEERGVWLTVAHIPVVLNELANFKSSNFADNIEWELSPKIFEKICRIFGHPEEDLLASRLNRKLPRYVSWSMDLEAWRVDAFSFDWSETVVYAFPPFSLVGRVLQKLLADQAKGIIMAPWWPTQHWFARLQGATTWTLKFRAKKANLKNAGHPDNFNLISRSPLGAFLF